MSSPTVTVITPTTEDRAHFNERCIEQVQKQDYPNIIEHLFDYSHFMIGRKLNNLCNQSLGEIIIRIDSDDIYSSDWVSRSVEALITSPYVITGLREGYFISDDRIYQNIYPKGSQPCLLGATMCFYRSIWNQEIPMKEDGTYHLKFNTNKPHGEDVIFCDDISKAGMLVGEHNYIEGFLATVHENNTSVKRLGNKHAFKRVLDYALPIGMRLP